MEVVVRQHESRLMRDGFRRVIGRIAAASIQLGIIPRAAFVTEVQLELSLRNRYLLVRETGK